METWRRKHSGKTFTVFGLSRKRMYSSLVDGYKLPPFMGTYVEENGAAASSKRKPRWGNQER